MKSAAVTYCKACGTRLADEDRYCDQCGNDRAAPAGDGPGQVASREKLCEACRNHVRRDDNYCDKCGTSLVARDAAVADRDSPARQHGVTRDTQRSDRSNTTEHCRWRLGPKGAALAGLLAVLLAVPAFAIIGGSPVEKSQYPWIAYVDFPKGTCTGALIDPQWVLTAAHCLEDAGYDATKYEVALGGTRPTLNDGERITVSQVFTRDRTPNTGSSRDIALLKLSQQAHPAPARLADELDDPKPTQALVAGFGDVSSSGQSADRLYSRKVGIRGHGRGNCANVLGIHFGGGVNAELCAQAVFCSGDSGGPLFINSPRGPAIIGVVSRSSVCGKGDDVYAPVARGDDCKPSDNWAWVVHTMGGSSADCGSPVSGSQPKPPPSPSPPPGRLPRVTADCGFFTATSAEDSRVYRFHVTLIARGLSCSDVVPIASGWKEHGVAPAGWTCHSADQEGKCTNGDNEVDYAGNGVPVGPARAQAPSAESSCQNVRGYYNVTVRGISCASAAPMLWAVRQTNVTSFNGFTCKIESHGPGGGYPADAVCTSGNAQARGSITDGPA